MRSHTGQSFKYYYKIGDKIRGLFLDVFKGLTGCQNLFRFTPLVLKVLKGVPIVKTFVACIGGLFKIISTAIDTESNEATVEVSLFSVTYFAFALAGAIVSSLYFSLAGMFAELCHNYYLLWESLSHYLFTDERKQLVELRAMYDSLLDAILQENPHVYQAYINYLANPATYAFDPNTMRLGKTIENVNKQPAKLSNYLHKQNKDLVHNAEEVVLSLVSIIGLGCVIAGLGVFPPLLGIGSGLLIAASIYGILSKLEKNPVTKFIHTCFGEENFDTNVQPKAIPLHRNTQAYVRQKLHTSSSDPLLQVNRRGMKQTKATIKRSVSFNFENAQSNATIGCYATQYRPKRTTIPSQSLLNPQDSCSEDIKLSI